MSITNYDYIIVGAGAAGLNLALNLKTDAYFKDKHLLIIDKLQKKDNDRTWSFWEKGRGKWDHLLHKSWNKGVVKAKGKTLKLDLKKYNYKTLRSSEFYAYAKEVLSQPTVTWITDEVLDIQSLDNGAVLQTKTKKYTADYIFDSRIPSNYVLEDIQYLNIAQHFKGWVIETETPVFDDSQFTMMDYSLKDGKSTSFTYILPYSPTQALIEFTYFSPDVVSENTYDLFLKKYIKEHLQIDHYEVIETEKGIIPMTSFPFASFSEEHIIKIGTAGGWVKASSGYSFKNCERKSKQIVEALKLNQNLNVDSAHFKYKHYDEIFLEVLTKENHFGEELFYRMYKNNSIQTIFRFLDEESSFGEDLQIILNLTSAPFIKGFIRHLKSRLKT